MAANLAGMFSQINNAIQGNPTADVFGNLLGNVSQGAGNIASGMLGVDNQYKFMNEQAKAQEVRDQVGQMDLSTAGGLSSAATQYGMAGQIENQMKLQQAAEAKMKEQKLRESIVAKANKLGLKSIAETTAAGGDLQAAADIVHKQEVADMLSKRGVPMRKALLKNAGFTEDEIRSYDIENLSSEDVMALAEGQKGSVKAYMDADGNPVMRRTSDYGRVWNPAKQAFDEASNMGLTPAPNVQRIHNVGDALTKARTDGAIASFEELRVDANDATETLALNQDALELLNAGINSGALGGIKTQFGKAAALLGADNTLTADAVRSEAYVGNRAKQIGQEIKAFGSGTGLSDKDAERAEKIAAGQESMSEDAMRFLITASNKLAQWKVDKYNEVLDPLMKGNDAEFVEKAYTLKPVPKVTNVERFETPEVSSTVNKYLEEARSGI